MRISNMPMMGKVLVIVALTSAGAAALGGLGLYAATALRGAVTSVDAAGDSALLGMALEKNVLELSRAEFRLAADPSRSAEIEREIDAAREALEADIAALQALSSAEIDARLAAIERRLETYRGSLDTMVAAAAAIETSARSAGETELLALARASRENAAALRAEVVELVATFDQRADGFAKGEASGSVVVERDQPSQSRAVLRGRSVKHDGRSASLTAPNGAAQQTLIEQALHVGNVEAHTITMLEAHGTGTALGDPTEVGSLHAALLATRSPDSPPLALSSVKASTAHAEPAAGMSGLAALLLRLERSCASPNMQLRALNTHVRDALRGASCAARRAPPCSPSCACPAPPRSSSSWTTMTWRAAPAS